LKYSKGFFNRLENRKRKPAAVRRPGASKSKVASPSSSETGRRFGLKDLMLPLMFLVALGCGWGFLWLLQPGNPQISWQACLEHQSDGVSYPTLIEIPSGTYEIPQNSPLLTPFMQFHDKPNIVLERPLILQNREVDLERFKHYVQEVENIQDPDERQKRKLRIGNHWENNDVQDSLVRHLSWEGAVDFTQWFSKKTGCNYRLPTREEWAAAVIHLNQDAQAEINGAIDPEGVIKNLLFGTREWSLTSCADGYYLLGGDDWTASADDRKEVCMSAMLAMGGFRLVLDPSSIPDPKDQTDPRGTAFKGSSLKMDAALSLDKTPLPGESSRPASAEPVQPVQ